MSGVLLFKRMTARVYYTLDGSYRLEGEYISLYMLNVTCLRLERPVWDWKYLVSNCVLVCVAHKQLQMVTLGESVSTVKFITLIPYITYLAITTSTTFPGHLSETRIKASDGPGMGLGWSGNEARYNLWWSKSKDKSGFSQCAQRHPPLSCISHPMLPSETSAAQSGSLTGSARTEGIEM